MFLDESAGQPPAPLEDTTEIRGDTKGVGPALGPVEAALVRALDLAASAGRWDVVAQLARELEARRLAQR
jgi:hypothetical protein